MTNLNGLPNGKHRAPAVGDYWIITTSLQQFVVRLTKVDAAGDWWSGVKQVQRQLGTDPYIDATDGRTGFGITSGGPLAHLTERVR